MKNIKLLLISFLTLAFSVNIYAQEAKEMTHEEWESEIKRLGENKVELSTEVAQLKEEVAALKVQYSSLQNPADCEKELLAMVGTTSMEKAAYAKQVEMLEKKINDRNGNKEDLQNELNTLKSSMISACPGLFDKVHNQLQRKLDAWVDEAPKEVLYTVVKGDCLWNIAKKKEIYGNGFAWPKIYNANKDQIKNPDLIYPKQIFKIPNLTEEEKAKYDKLRQNYKPAPAN